MTKSKILTDRENECLELLDKAQMLFENICEEDPQTAADSFNFGHYVDAARNALLIRGARRADPEALMPKRHNAYSLGLEDDFNFPFELCGSNE